MERKELNDNSKIEVKNDYTCSAIYKTDKITRVFERGTKKLISIEELYNAVNTKAGKVLFDEGILLIKDERVREMLGLKPLDEYSPEYEEIAKLLEAGSKEKLEALLQYCTDATLEKIVDKAIELPIQDLSKAKLIHSYSGKDILHIIREKEEEGEEVSTPSSDEPTPRRRRVVDKG